MATSLHETVQARPLPPWPLLGQERPVALLQGAIARDGVSHAYLFVGAAQSGRATLARAFAQTLNCETAPTSGGPPLAPCGLCRSCRKIERGLHPDVRVVGLATQEATSAKNRRESKNTSLSIDTIRDLCADLSLRPLEGRWRVAIVEDAETMREDAANAFLKTLEEPPPFAVLILLMPDAGATLTTIRSRCQVIETQPVAREALAQTLTARYNVSPAQARTLAALARGRVGWAIAASAQPDFFAGRQAAFDTMLGLLQGPAYDFFPAVDRWVDQFKRGRRDEVFADLDAWLGLWRDLLLMRSGCADLILNVDYADQLQAQAARYTLDRLRDAIAATRDGVRWLDENVAPRTALEAMVLRWQEDR